MEKTEIVGRVRRTTATKNMQEEKEIIWRRPTQRKS